MLGSYGLSDKLKSPLISCFFFILIFHIANFKIVLAIFFAGGIKSCLNGYGYQTYSIAQPKFNQYLDQNDVVVRKLSSLKDMFSRGWSFNLIRIFLKPYLT